MATKNFKLRILCVNDVYKPKQFSVFKSLKLKHESSEFKTLTVFPGDFLGGSLFAVSNQGESMLDVFNHVGFDYVTLGNHEFDYGSEVLEKLIEKSNFKWLGSNIRYSNNLEIFSKVLDYDIFEIPSEDVDHHNESVRIGVFGVTTSDTPMLSHPGERVIFENVEDHCKRVSTYLRLDKKCDIIIAMTHVSLDQDKVIADISNGNIDIIIGGHDHEPYILKQNDVLLVKCGQNVDYLGIIDLYIQVKTKRLNDNNIKRNITFHHSVQLLTTKGEMSDNKIDEIIKGWERLASTVESNSNPNEDLHEVLTTVDEHSFQDLSTRSSDCRLVVIILRVFDVCYIQ